VIGMKRNGRRLVIAPASMSRGQDSAGKATPGLSTDAAVLAFEIEVVRVRRKQCFVLD